MRPRTTSLEAYVNLILVVVSVSCRLGSNKPASSAYSGLRTVYKTAITPPLSTVAA